MAITAKLVANLLTVAGADSVLTMDLHAPQIQGFFDIPLDHIYAAPVLLRYFDQHGGSDLVVMAPDIGSIKMGTGVRQETGRIARLRRQAAPQTGRGRGDERRR